MNASLRPELALVCPSSLLLFVVPATYTEPSNPVVRALPYSVLVDPIKFVQALVPSGANFVMKASCVELYLSALLCPFRLLLVVYPATYTEPSNPVVRAWPLSSPVDPINRVQEMDGSAANSLTNEICGNELAIGPVADSRVQSPVPPVLFVEAATSNLVSRAKSAISCLPLAPCATSQP